MKTLHFWPRWSNKDWIYPLAENDLKSVTICGKKSKQIGFKYQAAKSNK